MVTLLIGEGAEIEAVDERGNTPLAWAVYGNLAASVEALVQNNANIFASCFLEKNREAGYHFIHDAVWAGHHEVVSALLARDAERQLASRAGDHTPLDLAVRFLFSF